MTDVKNCISKFDSGGRAKKKRTNSANSINHDNLPPAPPCPGALEVLSLVSRAPNNDQQKPREEEPRCGLAGEDGCAHLAGRGGTRVCLRTPPPRRPKRHYFPY